MVARVSKQKNYLERKKKKSFERERFGGEKIGKRDSKIEENTFEKD